MDGQEQEWVQSLAAMPPSKTRLKPYLGDEPESLEALRLHVSGRTARLRQADLDDTALLGAVRREVRPRPARLPAGDAAPRLVQIPPIPGGSQARPPGSPARSWTPGSGLSLACPDSGRTGRGPRPRNRSGRLNGTPAGVHKNHFHNNKTYKIVVRLTRTTATPADGLGTGRGSVGVPLGGWILSLVLAGVARGTPGGSLLLRPRLLPPPLRPTPALASPPTCYGPTPRLFRSVSSLLRLPSGPSCLLLVSAFLLPRSGSWRADRVSVSDSAPDASVPGLPDF